MKKTIACLILVLIHGLTLAQNKDEILKEAKLLYNSEKASWLGTDIFLERFPEKTDQIGGYFSYSENDSTSCIFFDKQDTPNRLAKITFDREFNLDKAKVDTSAKRLNALEMDLFDIRQKTFIELNSDTLFKFYNNTNFNVIPLISEKEKKVFVLTGPQVSGVVVFGNDYLLTFDKNNNLKTKRSIHNNILPVEYNEKTKGATAMHSHLKSTGDLITSTDLCTIMLYQDYAEWKQYIVTSKKQVSIWNCDTNELVVMSRKAWKKMSESLKNK